jgi:phosphomannomutase
MKKVIFNQEIIQKYDIRGIYGQNLFDQDSYHLGLCLVGYYQAVKHIQAPTFAIGHDCRTSAQSLKQKLKEGIYKAGGNVIDLGFVPTPLVNLFIMRHNLQKQASISAGIIITASHNPANYNGFKITDQSGVPIFGEVLQNLVNYVPTAYPLQKGHTVSSGLNLPLESWYVETLLGHFKGSNLGLQDQTIIWDVGNGIGGKTLKALCAKLPGHHILINEVPDPSFPDHTPDPSVEANVQSLKNAVLAHKADLGFALDMDADRLAVIDSEGQYWTGDLLTYLFCEELCNQIKDPHFFIDIKSSQLILDRVTLLGGKCTFVPTGHAIIKDLLKKHPNVDFAGEYSGHFYFAKEYGLVDDAFYAALKALTYHTKTPLNRRYKKIAKYPAIPQKKIVFSTHKEKNQAMEKITQHIQKNNDFSLLTLDGLRANYKEGWWLIRASNTEPLITYRCEGKNAQALKDMQQKVKKFLNECGLQEI